MKAILISIKPKYVADILNGKKTIEIRKTMPKCDLPIDVYIYMTKNGGELFNGLYTAPDMNGRVIAKFTLNKCQEWHFYSWQEITQKGCVNDEELRDYLKKMSFDYKVPKIPPMMAAEKKVEYKV